MDNAVKYKKPEEDLELKVRTWNESGKLMISIQDNGIGIKKENLKKIFEPSGGAIGLVHDDDIIEIDIPNRAINLKISDEELAKRRTEQDAKGWQPANREREVSFALKVFGHFATSADKEIGRAHV